MHGIKYVHGRKKKNQPAVLFTNASKCSVDAGIHTGQACLHGFSILSLEPESHLMLPNHHTSSSPDAVQCRSEALFPLYVSHDVSRMMLVTSLYISWVFFCDII